MAHDESDRDQNRIDNHADYLPKTITVVGQGTPASFEITVNGRIEMDSPNPTADATIVSGSTVEGAIESGTQQFHFSGDVTDVTITNRGGLESSSVVDPEIYVED